MKRKTKNRKMGGPPTNVMAALTPRECAVSGLRRPPTTSFRDANGERAQCQRRVSASRFYFDLLSSDHFSSRIRCSASVGPRSAVTCGRLPWMADDFAILRIASAMTSRHQRASGDGMTSRRESRQHREES